MWFVQFDVYIYTVVWAAAIADFVLFWEILITNNYNVIFKAYCYIGYLMPSCLKTCLHLVYVCLHHLVQF